jgi:hypothetical protein
MKLILESTTQIVEVNGHAARVWQGKTDNGVPVQVLISRVAVERTEDASEFDRELVEQDVPIDPAARAFPLRLIL